MITITPKEAFVSLRQDEGLSQTGAAEAIQLLTQRPCAKRTVQSWEADESVPSSRTCPEWAVEVLKKAIRTPLSKQHETLLVEVATSPGGELILGSRLSKGSIKSTAKYLAAHALAYLSADRLTLTELGRRRCTRIY